jgi:diguanylate cyclase (GGDEF)-like protein
MPPKLKKVLFAENPDTSDGSVRALLERLGTEIVSCDNGIDAVRKVYGQKPDLIVLDVHLRKMNGHQCARVLKQDPLVRDLPILHVAASGSALDRYWSKVCRADGYLKTPVTEKVWDAATEGLVFRRKPSRQVISHFNVIPELEDHAILMMATTLLEQDLLRANILNELNMIDTWETGPADLLTGLMTIIHSLYPFTLCAALLISGDHGEMYLSSEDDLDPEKMDEISRLVVGHLWQTHSMLLKPQDIRDFYLSVPLPEFDEEESGEIYIHTKEESPIYSALYFENIHVGEMTKEEQQVLWLALDMAHGVLEKKSLARKSQELSVIDMATKGYSLTFFMEVLGREISNARRNQYSLTLITIIISNFDEVTKDLHPEDEIEIIRVVQNAIFRTLRKADIIARWNQANFAFLLTHTSFENAKIPAGRVQKNVLEDISVQMPNLGPLKPQLGMCEFDPEKNQTPESFFADAMPKKTTPKLKEVKAPLRDNSEPQIDGSRVKGNDSVQ